MQKIILAYNFTPERLQALKLICMMLRTQLRAVTRGAAAACRLSGRLARGGVCQ